MCEIKTCIRLTTVIYYANSKSLKTELCCLKYTVNCQHLEDAFLSGRTQSNMLSIIANKQTHFTTLLPTLSRQDNARCIKEIIIIISSSFSKLPFACVKINQPALQSI